MPARSLFAAALLVSGALPLAACSRTETGNERSGHDGSASVAAASDFSTLRDFTAIDATGPDTVTVSVGKPFSVKVEGDREAIAELDLRIVDGTLRIGRKDGSGSFWGRDEGGVTVIVAMPALSALSITGSGNMSVDRIAGPSLTASVTGSGNLDVAALRVDRLTATVTGSGDVRLAGTAGSATFKATGSGDIESEGLKAGSAQVSVLGSGNVDFASDGAVEGSILGSGDVDVRGKARCTVSVAGSGDVHCS